MSQSNPPKRVLPVCFSCQATSWQCSQTLGGDLKLLIQAMEEEGRISAEPQTDV